jgi:hypothetical protein
MLYCFLSTKKVFNLSSSNCYSESSWFKSQTRQVIFCLCSGISTSVWSQDCSIQEDTHTQTHTHSRTHTHSLLPTHSVCCLHSYLSIQTTVRNIFVSPALHSNKFPDSAFYEDVVSFVFSSRRSPSARRLHIVVYNKLCLRLSFCTVISA